ncbi:MAG: 1,4-alpha-glucan branching enzyme, partial [Alteromonadaceae bacterium]
MKDNALSLLPAAEADTVLMANHDDIFSVLGMHPHPSGNGLIVRAFLPGASAVEVISSKDNKKVASLTMVNPVGLFEGKAGRRRNPFSYRLRIVFSDQQIATTASAKSTKIDKNDAIDIEDPYRFGSLLDEQDVYLFCEGTQERTWQWMGAHIRTVDGVTGMHFVVWAPDAGRVSVVADFNLWDGRRHVMRKHPAAGLWEIFIPGVGAGQSYKYEMTG